MRRCAHFPFVGIALLLALGATATAADASEQRPQAHIDAPQVDPRQNPALRPLAAPPVTTRSAAIARLSEAGDERVDVLVTIDVTPLARMSKSATPQARTVRAARIRAVQDLLLPQIVTAGGELRGRLRHALAGLLVSIPGRRAQRIATLPHVTAIQQLHDYQLHLDDTVPYIFADLVIGFGFDGSDVIVAVIDTGIDYTHTSFDGPGDPASYTAATIGADPGCIDGFQASCASGQRADPALFPNAKVIGGMDFVGDLWTGQPGSPPPVTDPNPIDFLRHGTHVAHAAAGSGPIPGVAPGAQLLAIKACGSQSFSCPGASVLLGVDFALDPDGNPATDDGADVINMSLGRPYGQGEDPLVEAANNAAAQGVLVVASAGNTGPFPNSASSPCVGTRVLCVGAEAKPLTQLFNIEAGADSIGALNPAWSEPLTSTIAGELTAGGDACDPFAADSFAGEIVLVDRGGCSFVEKSFNVGNAGGLVSIVGDFRAWPDNALPDPEIGLDGPALYTALIVTTDGTTQLAQHLGETVTIRADGSLPLDQRMAGFSSRGPAASNPFINKPDIAAPGTSIRSAVAGSGTLFNAISGTSMSAPHAAGAGALLKQAHTEWSPSDIKLALMNTATEGLRDGRPDSPQVASPNWAGAGTVNALAAFETTAFAWSEPIPLSLADRQGSLGLGYRTAADTLAFIADLFFFNNTGSPVTVEVASRLHNPSPRESGVSVEPLVTVRTVGEFGIVPIPIGIVVDPAHLPPWTLDRGAGGFDGKRYDLHEVDGRIDFTVNKTDSINVPWTILPKSVADVAGTIDPVVAPQQVGAVYLHNDSPIIPGPVALFNLLESSENRYNHTVGDCASSARPPGCGESPVDLADVGVNFRAIDFTGDGNAEPALEILANLHDAPFRTAALPAQIDVRIDRDLDGTFDIALFTATLNDGRNATFTFDYDLGVSTFARFTDSDFNSNNIILAATLEQMGIPEFGAAIDIAVLAWDEQNAQLWDCSPFPSPGNGCGSATHRLTTGIDRFDVGSYHAGIVAPGGTKQIPFNTTADAAAASPAAIGLVAAYRLAHPGAESQAFPLIVPGVDDDGDGTPNVDDCDPNDPGAFAAPGEVPFAGWADFPTTLRWTPINAQSGGGTTYDVFRETGGFGPVGAAPDGTFFGPFAQPEFQDVDVPALGEHFRYIPRGANGCGVGPLGVASDGSSREP